MNKLCGVRIIYIVMLILSINYTFAADIVAQLPGNNNADAFEIQDGDSTTLMTVRSNGNVGIGTSSPQVKLDVNMGAPLTGTVDVASGSAVVAGTGTNFSVGLSVGDTIVVGGHARGVIAINYDFSFIVDTAFNVTLSGQSIIKIAMVVPSGNVGIGVTKPAAKLHVQGGGIQVRPAERTSLDLAFFSNGETFTPNGSSRADIEFFNADNVVGAYQGLKFQAVGAQFAGAILSVKESLGSSARYGLAFSTSSSGNVGGGERLRVDGFGNVGIGVTAPSHPLEMASGAHVTAGGVWTNASSREYKENIRELTTNEAVTTLAALTPTKFNYKKDKKDEYVGFISEDVPDLVASKNRKGVSSMDIVAVLTKVLQEQQEIMRKQQTQLRKQELRIENLESRLE